MSNYRKSLKVYEPPECFKDGFDSFIHSFIKATQFKGSDNIQIS